MTLNVSARINRPLSVGSQCSRRFRVRSSVLACVLLDRKVYLTDARTHRDRYTQISGRRQRRRVSARFTVASRVVYSTLHSARTTHTHARPALCTRALERVCWEPNSVSSLCTLRLVLRRGPGFHLQRVYLWHLLQENVMHPASWWQAMVSISGSEACVRAWDTRRWWRRPGWWWQLTSGVFRVKPRPQTYRLQ